MAVYTTDHNCAQGNSTVRDASPYPDTISGHCSLSLRSVRTKSVHANQVLEVVAWSEEHLHLVRPSISRQVDDRLTRSSGDSWSDIGFDTSGPFPSSDNPFGNPVYPRLNDSYGAEWPVYFTQQFNSSLVKTFVLAKATSVVNNVIEPSRPDLVHQVQQVFLPTWGSRNASTWQSYDTLFIIFIGINDVGITVDSNLASPGTFDGLLWSYMVLVDQVSLCNQRLKSLAYRARSCTKLGHGTSYS